jgi:hypothetical protein
MEGVIVSLRRLFACTQQGLSEVILARPLGMMQGFPGSGILAASPPPKTASA